MRLCVLKDSGNVLEASDLKISDMDKSDDWSQGFIMDLNLTILYENVFKLISTPLEKIAQTGYVLGRKNSGLEVSPLNLKGQGGKTFSFYVSTPTAADPADAESVHTRYNPEGTWELVTLFGNEAVVYKELLDGDPFRELANLVASAGYALARKLAGLEVE